MKTNFVKLYTFLLLLSIAASVHADVIRGRVLDVNNKPISGADILVRYKSQGEHDWKYLQATSIANGAFEADTSNSVNFSKYYRPIIYAVAAGKAYSVAYLKQGKNVFHLEDAKIVSGYIVDQDEKPVVGAKVYLRSIDRNRMFYSDVSSEKPWSTRFQTFTDKKGYWQMRVVPEAGKASVTVNDPHILQKNFSVQEGMDPVTIQIRPGAIITGRVVDENGNPVAGVEVERSRRNTAVTNNEGVFLFGGVAKGEFYLSFDAGKRPLVASGVIVNMPQGTRTRKIPDVVMTSGCIIKGKVTNQETGAPISKVTVGSNDRTNIGIQLRMIMTHTDLHGEYKLRVPPGKRDVFAINNNGKYYSQSTFRQITIKEGQIFTQNFQIDPGLILSGIALDQQGKLLQGIKVLVDAIPIQSDYKLLARTDVTDKNGHWSISGIAPRKVQVRVENPWATKDIVTFPMPHSGNVKLHLIPQKELPPIGRILSSDEKPLAGAEVTLQYEMPHPTPFNIKKTTKLVTDQNGYYHFRLPLIAKSVAISNIQASNFLWISGGEWKEDTQRFSDVILDPLARQISGRVLDERGNPVANARVMAVAQGKAETTTNAKGEFVFTKLPDQQLTLLAIAKVGVAKVTPSTSTKSVTLRLKPLQQNLPPRSTEKADKDAAVKKPGKESLVKLREEYALSDGPMGYARSARLAGLIYGIDTSEGKVLFDHLLKAYWQQFNNNTPSRMPASDLAYYLARYKPRESWLMLQTEWAQSAFSQKGTLSQVALSLAMSAVDFKEAMNWAHLINGRTSPGETISDIRRDAQQWLSEIALATPEQRRNLCISCFYMSDSYKPGDPPMW